MPCMTAKRLLLLRCSFRASGSLRFASIRFFSASDFFAFHFGNWDATTSFNPVRPAFICSSAAPMPLSKVGRQAQGPGWDVDVGREAANAGDRAFTDGAPAKEATGPRRSVGYLDKFMDLEDAVAA